MPISLAAKSFALGAAAAFAWEAAASGGIALRRCRLRVELAPHAVTALGLGLLLSRGDAGGDPHREPCGDLGDLGDVGDLGDLMAWRACSFSSVSSSIPERGAHHLTGDEGRRSGGRGGS